MSGRSSKSRNNSPVSSIRQKKQVQKSLTISQVDVEREIALSDHYPKSFDWQTTTNGGEKKKQQEPISKDVEELIRSKQIQLARNKKTSKDKKNSKLGKNVNDGLG